MISTGPDLGVVKAAVKKGVSGFCMSFIIIIIIIIIKYILTR